MASDTTDLRPEIHNYAIYGGDTFSLKITVPAGVLDGYLWTGQLRSSRDPDTGVVDATFVITPPAVPGDPIYATLLAGNTKALAESGLPTTKRIGGVPRTFLVYTGDYDIQARHPTDPDPVISVVQGIITVDIDVTRAP